jgi:uncharacterized protein YjbJ (UPF0337 family)
MCDSVQTRLPGWLILTVGAVPHVARKRAGRLPTGVHEQEQAMGINKDQVEGRVKEAKGTIKEVAGKLVGNESLEAKGKIQKNVGKVQAKFGDVKEDVKDATKPL